MDSEFIADIPEPGAVSTSGDPFETIDVDIDAFEQVLEALPVAIQMLTLEHLEGLQEIRLIYGYPVVFNQLGKMKKRDEVRVEKRDVQFVRDKIGGFRSDWRAGINGTLHRFAGIPNRYESLVGVVIRLARAIYGVAEPLRPYLESDGSIMLVGSPGTGKTSLLRDVVRILGESKGQFCVAVDTSNEIGGDGDQPHPILGDALRVQVGAPARQGEVLRMVIANLTPEVLVVDEIGYHGNDVQHVETCSRRGVKVISTLHGEVLRDVVQNPAFHPLVGNVRLGERRRQNDTVFKMALELHGKGQWVLYPNLQEAVDNILLDKEPEGLRLGSWAGRGAER